MGDNKPGRDSDRFRFGRGADFRDLADAGFEDRERGLEAGARDRLFVQNAFVTLSTPYEVVWAGVRAGFHAGAVAVAVIGIVLVVMIAAVLAAEPEPGESLYGPTPVAGTILEPVWPLLLAVALMPYFAMLGGVAALVRRWENQWRRAINHYFDPIRPLGDLAIFMFVTSLLVMWGLQLLGLTGPRTDLPGLFIISFGVGGIVAWPVHSVWLKHFLSRIRRTGSASLDEIVACIRRQC